jgi:tight adherence protein C
MSALALTILGIFVLTAVATGSATSWWLAHNSPEQKRIRSLGAGASTSVGASGARLVDGDLDPVLSRLSSLAPRSASEMGKLQRQLSRAGYPSRAAAIYFSAARVVLPFLFGGVVLFTFGVGSWLYAVAAAALGYITPGLYIQRQTNLRKKAIQNGLADCLDLLMVCVEAGSGLDQAIAKASDELAITHPVLASELVLITTETRAGKPRLEAFQNFARRTGVEDVRSLVNMLTQTDRFGTSVGQALRGHAETIRTKRRQRAEERAGKVGVKLVFPLALCLFPALYIVCFGPVVVRIYRAFF